MADKYLCLMQPHFFPAFSYFEMIAKAEKFVFLTKVQISKQSFQTRNRILLNGQANWITCSIDHSGKSKLIADTKFKDLFWKKKLIKKLTQCYADYPFGSDVNEIIEFLEVWDSSSLCDFNISLTEFVVKKLKLESNLILDSELDLSETRAARIFDLLNMHREYVYLYPNGSKKYMIADGIFKSSFVFSEFEYTPFYFETSEIRYSFVEAVAMFGWTKLINIIGNKNDTENSSIKKK